MVYANNNLLLNNILRMKTQQHKRLKNNRETNTSVYSQYSVDLVNLLPSASDSLQITHKYSH